MNTDSLDRRPALNRRAERTKPTEGVEYASLHIARIDDIYLISRSLV
jgi:hypothetical protein